MELSDTVLTQYRDSFTVHVARLYSPRHHAPGKKKGNVLIPVNILTNNNNTFEINGNNLDVPLLTNALGNICLCFSALVLTKTKGRQMPIHYSAKKCNIQCVSSTLATQVTKQCISYIIVFTFQSFSISFKF